MVGPQFGMNLINLSPLEADRQSSFDIIIFWNVCMYKLLISGSFIHTPPVICTNDTIWKWHHPLTLPINSTLTIVMSLFVAVLFTEMGLCLCKMNMRTVFLHFSCVRKEKSVKAFLNKLQRTDGFYPVKGIFFYLKQTNPVVHRYSKISESEASNPRLASRKLSAIVKRSLLLFPSPSVIISLWWDYK